MNIERIIIALLFVSGCIGLGACDSGDAERERKERAKEAQEERAAEMREADRVVLEKYLDSVAAAKVRQNAKAGRVTAGRLLILLEVMVSVKGDADIWPASFYALGWPWHEFAKDGFGQYFSFNGKGEIRSYGADGIPNNTDDKFLNADGSGSFEAESAREIANEMITIAKPSKTGE